MIRIYLMLLGLLLLSPLPAQQNGTSCADPLSLKASIPTFCPEPGRAYDTLAINFQGAPTAPEYSLCQESGALSNRVARWVEIQPQGNLLRAILTGPAQPSLTLLRGEDCSAAYPIACATGENSVELQVNTTPEARYFLLASSEANYTAAAQLTTESTYNCDPCHLVRDGFFTASPAPVDGHYEGGQTVEMCFTVTQWETTPTSERLHALELSFGPGWDLASLSPQEASSCDPGGIWAWQDSWQSAATGQQFGPGFAFDILDGSQPDGNPGNNLGMDGLGCSSINALAGNTLQFCWTITAQDCPPNTYGTFNGLEVGARLLGDGLSGSRPQTQCYAPETEVFLSGYACPDPYAPEVALTDASCRESCDGQVVVSGGGQGPWRYQAFDSTGTLIWENLASTTADTLAQLCPGQYTLSIRDYSSNQDRNIPVIINTGVYPVATATFEQSCFDGEPIYLYGQVSPVEGDVQYEWSGPNGYARETAAPLALSPGTYTLQAYVNDCPAAPVALDILAPSSIPIAEIEADTLTACPGTPITIHAIGNAQSHAWQDPSTGELLGTGDSITLSPVSGRQIMVSGTNANGCFASDVVYLSVPLSPELSVSPQGVICAGTAVTIRASAGTSFSWDTGAAADSIVIAPLSSQTYAVTITGEGGCQVVRQASITVASDASFFVSPDQAICAGESAPLIAIGGASVVWSTGETTPAIQVSPAQTTTYTAIQTDEFGCEHGELVTVNVNPDPAIHYFPADTLICAGDSVELFLFQSDTLLWSAVAAPESRRFYSTPYDFGCLNDPRFFVDVESPPSLSIGEDQSLCSPDTILLFAEGNYDSLFWSNGSTADTAVFFVDATAHIFAEAYSESGCTSTDSIEVSLNALPDLPQADCAPRLGSVLFTWATDGEAALQVNALSGQTADSTSADGAVSFSGLFPEEEVAIERALIQNGCSRTDTLVCAALPCSALSLTTFVPDTLCSLDGQASLIADVQGGTPTGNGQWAGTGVDSTGSLFDPRLAGAGAATLVYRYTDQGCTLTDTAWVMVETGLENALISCESGPDYIDFTWPALPQDTAYLFMLADSTQTAAFNATNQLRVAGLMTGDTAALTLQGLGIGWCGNTTATATCVLDTFTCAPLQITADTFLCPGEVMPLHADSLNWDSWSWAPATGLSCTDCPSPLAQPNATTTYQLIAANAQGCTDTAVVTLFVGEIPDEYVPAEPIVFCPGQPLELCLPDGVIHYWVGPNAFIRVDQCLSFDAMEADMGGNYYAFMRTEACRLIKPFRMEAAPPIELDSLTEQQTVCPSDTFALSAYSPQAVSYAWAPASYLECGTCAATTGSVLQTATFSLTMTDAYGCQGEAEALVFVPDCEPAGNRPASPGHAQPLAKPRLYPNPASDALFVELPAGQDWTLTVISTATGRALYQQDATAGTVQIPVGRLSPGTYMARATAEQETHIIKFVVSR